MLVNWLVPEPVRVNDSEAMPLPASTSAKVSGLLETLKVVSSVAVTELPEIPASVGASLTGVTVTASVSDSVEKALVWPLLRAVLTRVPAVPVVWSQAM